MSIIAWVVIGGLAGWVASLIMSTDSNGVIGNIIVGIIGGFIGGYVFSALGGAGFTGFNMWSFVLAVVGAVILLGFVRLMGGGQKVI